MGDAKALWGEGIVTALGPQGSYEIDLDEHHAEVGSLQLTDVSSQCVSPLLLVRYDGHEQQAKSVRALLQVSRRSGPPHHCDTVPPERAKLAAAALAHARGVDPRRTLVTILLGSL